MSNINSATSWNHYNQGWKPHLLTFKLVIPEFTERSKLNKAGKPRKIPHASALGTVNQDLNLVDSNEK